MKNRICICVYQRPLTVENPAIKDSPKTGGVQREVSKNEVVMSWACLSSTMMNRRFVGT